MTIRRRTNGRHEPVTYGDTEALRQELEEKIEERIRQFMPKNAESSHLAGEGHKHNIAFHGGGGGIVHYDYVVDASYTGAAGATITMTGGSTAKIYATIQAAIDAADADNAARTILINAGTYVENVTISTTFSHSLRLIGAGSGGNAGGSRTHINPASGAALTVDISYDVNTAQFEMEGIRLSGDGLSSPGTLGPPAMHINNCYMAGTTGTYRYAWLDHCFFENSIFSSGATTEDVFVSNSRIETASTWSGLMRHTFFDHCFFDSSITSTANIDNLGFSQCQFPSSFVFTKNGGTCNGLVFDDDCIFGLTATNPGANGYVYFQSVTAPMSGAYIGGRMNYNSGAATFVKSDDTDTEGVAVFARLGRNAGGSYTEDNAGISIVGSFKNSVFICTPSSFALQLDAGTNNLYVGTGAVTGAAALSGVRVALPQRGSGPPTHTAPEGTPYWDTTNNNYYVNSDGGTTWQGIGGASVGNLTVQLNDVSIDTNVTVVDFTDADATSPALVTSSPAGEANVNMTLYAKLAGRSAANSQTMAGGTATDGSLFLYANAVDLGPAVFLTGGTYASLASRNFTGVLEVHETTPHIRITGNVRLVSAAATLGGTSGLTVIGGTAAAEILKLQGTSHATPGEIRLLNPTKIGADSAPAAGTALHLAGGALRLADSPNNVIQADASNYIILGTVGQHTVAEAIDSRDLAHSIAMASSGLSMEMTNTAGLTMTTSATAGAVLVLKYGGATVPDGFTVVGIQTAGTVIADDLSETTVFAPGLSFALALGTTGSHEQVAMNSNFGGTGTWTSVSGVVSSIGPAAIITTMRQFYSKRNLGTYIPTTGSTRSIGLDLENLGATAFPRTYGIRMAQASGSASQYGIFLDNATTPGDPTPTGNWAIISEQARLSGLAGSLFIGTIPTVGATTGVANSATAAGLSVAGLSYTVIAGQSGRVALISGTIVENSSGTHPRLMGLEVTAPTITAGAATVTDAATVYISGATAATVTGGNYALWVDAGATRLDGDLDHRGTNVGFYGATPAARQTYTPTNVTTDRSFDANATTIDELADVVGTIIADFQTIGLMA